LNDPFNGVPEEDDIDDEVGQCRLTLSNPRLKRLELSAWKQKHNEPLSSFAFKSNLRRCNEDTEDAPRAHTTSPASSQVLPNWMSPAPLGAAAVAGKPVITEEERQAMEREMRDAKKSRGVVNILTGWVQVMGQLSTMVDTSVVPSSLRSATDVLNVLNIDIVAGAYQIEPSFCPAQPKLTHE